MVLRQRVRLALLTDDALEQQLREASGGLLITGDYRHAEYLLWELLRGAPRAKGSMRATLRRQVCLVLRRADLLAVSREDFAEPFHITDLLATRLIDRPVRQASLRIRGLGIRVPPGAPTL
mgnify:FL=1